jgi:hypothetical protein
MCWTSKQREKVLVIDDSTALVHQQISIDELIFNKSTSTGDM